MRLNKSEINALAKEIHNEFVDIIKDRISEHSTRPVNLTKVNQVMASIQPAFSLLQAKTIELFAFYPSFIDKKDYGYCNRVIVNTTTNLSDIYKKVMNILITMTYNDVHVPTVSTIVEAVTLAQASGVKGVANIKKAVIKKLK